VCVAVLAAGCTVSPATGSVNVVGFTPAFVQGYSEGCDSAGALRPWRDESRYQAEPEFERGWNDGYNACRRGR
jgi:hypothetical protein